MLIPADIDQQLEIILRSQVQEPARWNVIHAQQISPQLADQREIARRLFMRWEWVALDIWGKWPVRHTLEVELLLAEAEKFAANARPKTGCESFWHFWTLDSARRNTSGAPLFYLHVQMMVLQRGAFVLGQR